MIIATKGKIDAHTVFDNENDVIFVNKLVENNRHTTVTSSLLFQRSSVERKNLHDNAYLVNNVSIGALSVTPSKHVDVDGKHVYTRSRPGGLPNSENKHFKNALSVAVNESYAADSTLCSSSSSSNIDPKARKLSGKNDMRLNNDVSYVLPNVTNKCQLNKSGNQLDSVHDSLSVLFKNESNWICSIIFPTEENPEGVDIMQYTDKKYERKKIFLADKYNGTECSYKSLKEDVINAAFNSGTKLHVRGKGEFRCFRSRTYVPDKRFATAGRKKHHGIKHPKRPDEMNPAFQSDLRNTTFHND